MSRSNPNKKKLRYARKTAQIVVEGNTEEAFCRHLKNLFARDCGVSVEVHSARGGAPKEVVASALRRKGFDKTFLMYDTDVELEKGWSSKSKAAGHVVIASSPCVEGFFLEILEKPVPATSMECKRAFSSILGDTEKCDYHAYEKVFPKELLLVSRNPALKLLLTAFGKLVCQ